ncbi:mannose-1-phosphate guanylyltransferase [Candidatus Planktophila sulfonica]|uniref:Mannose-1-phosphate guanylyltransferase n=1 Tax=Candidatus Planktophila sulfonica TaxID=1884904 RepID=A0A249KHT4_9ACTN|nr:NDP-sugar synthase [Candidatus Planktophila sulfonica]ASY16249.1 mannose-1-phosphate guanylyltransferase [Candidatus Planktophila sulfonica]
MAVGILLVGGFGTRLKPLTDESPKPMLPVAGLPVTEHQILAAKKAGIHTLVLATSYLADVFTPYFGDGAQWGMKILYAVEKEPLGTGGAIRNAAELLGRDEPVVIFNGDVLSRHSIADQIAFHLENKADVTLHLIDVADARAFGCVPTDSDGRVTAFLEKMDNPVTNSINAGCYVFSPSVIDQIPLGKVVSVERETFPALVSSGRPVFGYKEQSYWLDVGTPAALFKGSRDLVDGDFQAMADTTIASDARITGGTSIGARCSIGSGVEIDDCIIGDDVTIGDGAVLAHSFIAHGTEVAAGTNKSAHYLSKKLDLPINL